MHQDPGEKSSDPTGDSNGLACGCPGVSGGGVGRWWPAAGLGALSVAVHAWDLLKEVAITFTAGREHSSTHQQNRIKDLLSTAQPIRTRPSFPLSQFLPSGSIHKPLILLHRRADTLKTTITEN